MVIYIYIYYYIHLYTIYIPNGFANVMPWNIQRLSLHSALKQTEIEPLDSWKADHTNVMLMTITTHTKCKPKATRAAFRVEECLGASKLSEPSASKLSGLLSGSCLRYVKVLASRSFCIWNGISWCYPMAVSSRLGHPRITLTYTSIIYLWLAEKSVASAIKSLGLPDLKQPRKWNMIPVIESISTFICEIGEILHCPGFFVPRYARPTIP